MLAMVRLINMQMLINTNSEFLVIGVYFQENTAREKKEKKTQPAAKPY